MHGTFEHVQTNKGFAEGRANREKGAVQGNANHAHGTLPNFPGLISYGSSNRSRNGFPQSYQPSTMFEQPSQQQTYYQQQHQQMYPSVLVAQPKIGTANHPDNEEYKYLKTQNAELAQALFHKDKELETANQAVRDLAAWTKYERTRLMTEALHQRLLREDGEVILQRRDEQIVHLLALHQEARLEHARTLVREGETIGLSVSASHIQNINEMRTRVGLLPIDRRGVLQNDGSANMDISGRTQRRRASREPWATSRFQANASHNLGADISMAGGRDSLARNFFNTAAVDEIEMAQDEEGSFSPPDFRDIPSIVDQVDELVAEAKARSAAV